MVLIVGDLADNGHAAQEAAQRDIFDTLGVPYHVVPGNHDHLTDDDRSGYDAIFGKFLNYTFDHNGWRFIALDTTQGVQYQDTTIQPATLNWLDENLPKFDKSQPTIVFTHFPMGPHVPYRPTNSDALLERLKPFNIQAIFDGHFHGFTERFFKWDPPTKRSFDAFPITTDKCCALKRWNHDGTKEKGYFLCQAKDGRLTREFVEVNFPGMPSMPEGTKIVQPPT
jgi:3',5'-cyclic AMP phosphodiesterase CpdA